MSTFIAFLVVGAIAVISLPSPSRKSPKGRVSGRYTQGSGISINIFHNDAQPAYPGKSTKSSGKGDTFDIDQD